MDLKELILECGDHFLSLHKDDFKRDQKDIVMWSAYGTSREDLRSTTAEYMEREDTPEKAVEKLLIAIKEGKNDGN